MIPQRDVANWAKRLIILCVWASAATAGSGQACEPDHIDSRVQVAAVYDGDTVLLDSGEKLRIIGLNTPELGYEDRPPQAFAEAATLALEALLSRHQHRVSLRYGQQRFDNYARTLAHVFLADGSSVAAQLIEQGLATALTIPPNTWNTNCYHDAERRAHDRQLGIWSLPEYRVVDSKHLPRGTQGYRKVRGKVVRVGSNRRSTWLNLEGPVVLRIDHEDRRNFTGVNPVNLGGVRLIASGWLYPRKHRLHMRVRHQSALEIE